MLKKNLTILFLAIFCYQAYGNNTVKNYWIEFSDKNHTPYTVNKPYEFLSPRALVRREKQGIPIMESDLPVDPAYVYKIQQFGAKILHVSKWLNAATIVATESVIEKISKLDFVKKIEFVGRYFTESTKQSGSPGKNLKNYRIPDPYHKYGYGRHQIQMVNGDILHDLGFRGEGKLVAVMDGGFINVNHMPFFDSLRIKGNLLPGKDLVEKDYYIFESATHGSQVLSVMAANLPGLFVGTAPDASYVCIKTEDVRGEYLTEECNWVAGLEYADSIGADIVNSSLGYTTFWDKKMNYTYEDLDGKKSRASVAADIAFSKGMIVVNSAGNSGSDDWKYIGTPADANNIFTVGATDYYGRRAPFSSFGPTADGRLKPNVAAMGMGIIVAKVNGYRVERGNGTSFSSPFIAGMIATLWGAFPDKTNEEIIESIELHGSQFDKVNTELGFGIPDFFGAYHFLNGSHETKPYPKALSIFPKPFSNEFELVLLGRENGLIKIHVNDLLGKSVFFKTFNVEANKYNRYLLELDEGLKAGFYTIIVENAVHTFFAKTIMKH